MWPIRRGYLGAVVKTYYIDVLWHLKLSENRWELRRMEVWNLLLARRTHAVNVLKKVNISVVSMNVSCEGCYIYVIASYNVLHARWSYTRKKLKGNMARRHLHQFTWCRIDECVSKVRCWHYCVKFATGEEGVNVAGQVTCDTNTAGPTPHKTYNNNFSATSTLKTI